MVDSSKNTLYTIQKPVYKPKTGHEISGTDRNDNWHTALTYVKYTHQERGLKNTLEFVILTLKNLYGVDVFFTMLLFFR